MSKIGVGSVLLLLYCFPYVYFSMYLDFANRSMLGYLIMVAVTGLIAYISKSFGCSIIFLIGNIITGMVSFYFINEMTGVGNWDVYFKPLKPSALFIVASVLNLIPQFAAIKFARAEKLVK